MDFVCPQAVNVALEKMVPWRQIATPSVAQALQGAGACIRDIEIIHDYEYIDLRFGRQFRNG